MGTVVAIALLVVHMPTVLLLVPDDPGPTLGILVATAASTAGLAGWSWLRPKDLRGELLSVLVTGVTVLSLYAAALIPPSPRAAAPSHLVLLFVPAVFMSVAAFAPVRPRIAITMSAAVVATHIILWRAHVLPGTDGLHALTLGFLAHTAAASVWLAVIRRRNLRALYARELELASANDELRALVDSLDSTRDSLRRTHDELVTSERMATLGRFLAGLAHEVHSPLAAVRYSLAELETLLGELSVSLGHPTVTVADLREIVGEAEASRRLADDAAVRAVRVLDGVKLQTRTFGTLETRRFDLVEEARSSIALLRHRVLESGVDVHLQSEGEIWLVGDPGACAHILTNLLENALYACEHRDVAPVVVALCVDADEVVLRVVDRGPGIDPAVAEHVFDPLVTSKPPGKGTGLGLSICRELVHAMGGWISAYETPGGGATFEARLRTRRSDTGAPAARLGASSNPPRPAGAAEPSAEDTIESARSGSRRRRPPGVAERQRKGAK